MSKTRLALVPQRQKGQKATKSIKASWAYMEGLEVDANYPQEDQQETYLVIIKVDDIGKSASAQASLAWKS